MAPGRSDLAGLEKQARREIGAAETPQALVEVRARYLGRKGSISGLLRSIGALEPEARARVGQEVNAARDRVEAWAGERDAVLREGRRERQLRDHRLDATLPGAAQSPGRLHALTHVERHMFEFFHGLGFSIEEGPEVETDWHNFGALNFPDDHPARDMQDTFFFEGGQLLRTHTSPVQIRAMTGRQPPLRFIAPGKVYRPDLDATHYPMFHQIEGFMVDEQVTFADLKGVLHAFARHVFGPETRLRFRAHFFPFTEPSAEMDFSWGDSWLEWGGCGMIHPNVLANCGIDPERYQGFAFGMGIDRTAMDRYGLANISLLFSEDVRILGQI